MFRNLFQNATRTGQVPAVAVELENFKAYESQLPSAQHVAENFDAVLLTGSVSDIWEMDRKIWIRKLLDWIRELQAYNEGQPTEKKIRMLGSCFGHQVSTHSANRGLG